MQLFSMYYFTYSRHCGDLTTNVPEASWMGNEPHKLRESKLSDNKEENLYEYLPEDTPPQSDGCTQQTFFVTNPFRCDSTPTADDVQFNFSGDLVDPYEPLPHHP